MLGSWTGQFPEKPHEYLFIMDICFLICIEYSDSGCQQLYILKDWKQADLQFKSVQKFATSASMGMSRIFSTPTFSLSPRKDFTIYLIAHKYKIILCSNDSCRIWKNHPKQIFQSEMLDFLSKIVKNLIRLSLKDLS